MAPEKARLRADLSTGGVLRAPALVRAYFKQSAVSLATAVNARSQRSSSEISERSLLEQEVDEELAPVAPPRREQQVRVLLAQLKRDEVGGDRGP